MLGADDTDRFYGPTNQYKRLASIYNDRTFQAGEYLVGSYVTLPTNIHERFLFC